jgi:PAS domain S-box-containing protein
MSSSLVEQDGNIDEKAAILEMTLESMDQGVSLFDAKLNVVVFNRRFLEILGFPTDRFSLGDNFENFIRFNAERGEYGDGEVEELVRSRVERARRFEPHAFERTRPDGTVVEIRGYPVPGGGFLTTYTDITERKRIERELGGREERLALAIGSISEGFSLFDADDRLALCNDRYRELYPGLADIIEPGVSFEQIIRTAAARGVVDGVGGYQEDWVRERLEHHRNPSGPILQRQSDGRWIQINERRTGDGGTVAVFTDVTDLKHNEEELAQAIQEKDAVLGEFHVLMDAVDYGILFLGPDLRARFSNRAFGEMWEFPRELLASGANMRELMENVRRRGLYTIPDDEFDDYARVRLEAIRAGDIAPVEFHIADGRVFQYQCKGLPDGGRMLTYFDITALKRTERALRESEQRFRDFASSSSDWFYEMGPDLRFAYLSERFEEVTGVSPGGLLGKTREEFGKGGTDDKSWDRHLADLRAHRPFKDFRFQVVAGQERILWVTTSGVPVFDEDGEFRGYRGSSSDVTEAILNEQAIRQAKNHAERALAELKHAQKNLVQAEKLALLGQLVAGIAHEIKNPLNFINNFADLSAELLEELREILIKALTSFAGPGRAEIDDHIATLISNLEKISEHGGRADSIVKSMLSHSRGGPGERREADINALVEESLNLAYHGARAQDQTFNITLDRDYDDGIGTLEVIPQDLSRVFLNLFNNGFYATRMRRQQVKDPGYQPILRVSTRDLGEAAEIRIRDNGTGMPADVVDKIFTPFFTTKPAGEGTGLGLSLSYDIVAHQHNGTFDVDTREGEYTAFTITLPHRTSGGAPQSTEETIR